MQRLVALLHSADQDAQSHAHVALTGLIRSSQLRTPSVITRAGDTAALAPSHCHHLKPFPVVDRSTVEKVFQGIEANGFAASSASLGVLVELISKLVRSLGGSARIHFRAVTTMKPLLFCDNSIRCVAETSNEDGNEQCAGVVSVIVSARQPLTTQPFHRLHYHRSSSASSMLS